MKKFNFRTIKYQTVQKYIAGSGSVLLKYGTRIRIRIKMIRLRNTGSQEQKCLPTCYTMSWVLNIISGQNHWRNVILLSNNISAMQANYTRTGTWYLYWVQCIVYTSIPVRKICGVSQPKSKVKVDKALSYKGFFIVMDLKGITGIDKNTHL